MEMKFQGKLPTLQSEPAKFVDYMGANGHWLFPEQMGAPYVGFIYVIYDNTMNRAYLGKKQFYGTGKLNRGQESNWKKYVSSSKLLHEMLGVREKSDFEFICIEQYRSKGALSYAETWSLCLAEVPTTKNWYNVLIEKVSWSVSERVTDRHKERLNKIIERVKNGNSS